MRATDHAICLRTIDYSETSQVVYFLTRTYGPVRLLAKGTKRPKSKSGGAIDLLSEGELTFSTGKEAAETLGTLWEFTETVVHSALRTQARRLHAALYALELAGEMLAPGDPHPEVFDLLHNTLVRLGQADAPVPAVLAYFQWRFLRRIGLLGDMRRCVICGTAIGQTGGQTGGPAGGQAGAGGGGYVFSSSQGGLLCPACQACQGDKYRLDGHALAGLAALQAAQAGAKVPLPDKQAHAVNRLLAYHAAQQLGKPLRMARHAIG